MVWSNGLELADHLKDLIEYGYGSDPAFPYVFYDKHVNTCRYRYIEKYRLSVIDFDEFNRIVSDGEAENAAEFDDMLDALI